jgi:hypothetical protein
MPDMTNPREELGYWIGVVTNLSFCKSDRETALRNIRQLEDQLGLPHRDYVRGYID